MEPLNPVKPCRTSTVFFGNLEKNCSRPWDFFEPRRTSQNLIERCGTSRTCSILRKSIQPYGFFFEAFFSPLKHCRTFSRTFMEPSGTLKNTQNCRTLLMPVCTFIQEIWSCDGAWHKNLAASAFGKWMCAQQHRYVKALSRRLCRFCFHFWRDVQRTEQHDQQEF